ncbi:MAG: DNA polymerase I [Elusimicrobiota bacterium]
MEKKSFYIIDGTAYVHRAFYALPMLTTKDGMPVNAVYGFIKMIRKIIKDNRPDYCIVCFDYPAKTFRHKMFEEYKSQRKKTPEELIRQIPLIKNAVTAMGLPYIEREGFEADDIIATLVKKARSEQQDAEIVLVTGDKDILQLVDKNVKVLAAPKNVIYDEAGVEEKFGVKPGNLRDYLALLGDISDNIPGVKGIGKVAAQNIISEYGAIPEIIKKLEYLKPAYKSKIEQNIEQLKLSYDLIALNYDVPIDDKIESYAIKDEFQSKAFKDFLKVVEFNKLLQEIESDNNSAPRKENENIAKSSYGVIASFSPLNETKYSIAWYEDLFSKGVALYSPLSGFMFADFNDRDKWRGSFNEFLSRKNRVLVTEDFKKLYKILNKYFSIKLDTDIVFDAVVAAYILDSSVNSFEDALFKYRGEEVSAPQTMDETLKRMEKLYSLSDLLNTEMKEDGLQEHYTEIELPFCRVLAVMEEDGVKLDCDYLKKLSIEFETELKSLTEIIYKSAGEQFNINSPKQLAVILFEKLGLPVIEKTKTGPSTSEYVLNVLAKSHPLPDAMIRYRELAKIKSTYVDALPLLVNPETGRLHTSFNHTLTATGRLSSSSPNIQNIPIRTDTGRRVRRAFVASKGCKLIAADYSQIDLTVLAELSDDETMKKAFIENKDIHTVTASEIFGMPLSGISNEQRNIAKRINFGLVYGMSSFGLAKDLGLPRKEADSFINAYFNKYTKIKNYMDNTISFAQKNGFVKTLFGRKRFIKEIKSPVFYVRSAGERMAINTPVQGTAADIIKKSMVDLGKKILNEKMISKMILQIHDEIILEAPDSEVDRCIKIIKDIMENAVKLRVPLRVNIEVGNNWEEMEGA